eukprot:3194495-Alexandrium_andersonii.AAC.1
MMQGAAETTKVLGRVRRVCEEVRRTRTASAQSWSREMQNHWGKLLSVQGRFPQIGGLCRLVQQGVGWNRLYLALRQAASSLEREAQRRTSTALSRKRAAYRERLSAKGAGLGATYRAMRPAKSPALAFLATEGGPVTHPTDLDE